MTCPCEGLGFTEIVKCEIENGRQIAQGWAQCHGRTWTGRGGHYEPYSMPWGWEYDPRYTDKFGGLGTHGGCQYCSMTLIHLRKIAVVKDPCADVSCPTVCVGDDRYIQKCEDGACVRDRLLMRNSPDCGYEPPAPTPTPTPTPVMHPIGTKVTYNTERWVVIGYEHPLTSNVYKLQALHDGRRTTASGEHFTDITLPKHSCADGCPAKCWGVDKYTQACYNGVCVQGTLLEANSEDCGYEQRDPTPTPTTDTYVYAIIALMVVGTYIMLRR